MMHKQYFMRIKYMIRTANIDDVDRRRSNRVHVVEFMEIVLAYYYRYIRCALMTR